MADVVVLDNGKFRAEIVPEIGGNIISLRHLPCGTKLLQEPADLRELAEYPARFGLPVLFPPNRIQDGRFTFEGKCCFLTINEPANHNHLHGLALKKPWTLTAHEKDRAELFFVFSPEAPEYAGFPFAFTLKRVFSLTASGLSDRMTVTNQGKWNMPLGLGYHSTFPANPAKIRMGTGDEEFEIGERFLPTGRRLAWGNIDPRQWFDPRGVNIGFHSTAAPMRGEDGTVFRGAEILYESGLLRYITDEKFRFWYTWNKRGEGDFISLEPISWMADALNRPEPPKKTGVRILEPGAQSVFQCALRFYPHSPLA